MNYKKIILILLILSFVVVAIYSMSGVLTPYVSFKSAIESESYVQVIGKLNKSIPVRHYEGYFTFNLKDDNGALLDVLYRGAKPLNFEHTDQIVALGLFSSQKNIFEAEKILIKCPSKYKKENK